MHRSDQFLKNFSRDAKSKATAASTLHFSADVALATVLNDKYGDMRKVSVNSRNQSSKRAMMGRCRGSSSAHGHHSSTARAGFGESNIMEPVRMLHQCIRYFASHPEIYGGNIRALLDRELMYVMRMKASETALVSPGMVPVLDTPLPPIMKAKGEGSKLQHPKLSKCSGWMVSPSSIDAALSTGTLVRPEGVFGFGGTSFVEATPGFLSLFDGDSRQVNLPDSRQLIDASQIVDDAIDGEGEIFLDHSPPELRSVKNSEDTEEDSHSRDGLQPRLVRGDIRRALNVVSSASSHTLSDAGTKVLIDGAGYEVAFLRNQLQQVEAAYNSRCIQLHELQEENRRNISKLQDEERELEQYKAKIHEMRLQMDCMKRELDAWKQHASELNLRSEGKTSQDSSDMSRRMQAVQFSEAKRELAHISRLWRETEKSLQETRRSLESAEKETQVSQGYLEDAFHLIERLERRIERRENFIEAQKRRQASQEEKYTKLMWCLQELQVMKGVHSYVDLLLSEDPIWFLFLFVRLQRRFMSFSHLDEPTPSNPGPLYFLCTQGGGRLLDTYSPKLVYKLMVDDISGKIQTQSTEVQVTFPGKMPRWRGSYAIDYLTGGGGGGGSGGGGGGGIISGVGDSISSEGIEMMHRNLPVLTLASVLLPQQNAPVVGDILVEDDVPNTRQYDRGAIRMILYCFWGERVAQYKREMRRSLHALKAKSAHPKPDLNSDDETVSEMRGEAACATSSLPSFLTALVEFAHRLYPPAKKPVDQANANANAKNAKLLVRGVVVRNEKLYSNRRMFFSSIINVQEDGTETPVELSPQSRELLFAMYYYAEEYKEVDSDFRLFHLVAHQLIPELVGINFYASMEALRNSCDETLCRHLGHRALNNDESPETAPTDFIPKNEVVKETPIEALMKAVVVIDTAPLVDGDTSMEPDSEGEGFGSILPGKRSSDAARASRRSSQRGSSSCSSSRSLKHNIHEYLLPLSDGAADSEDGNIPSRGHQEVDTTNGAKVELPKTWVTLDERLGFILGSHVSLLEAFEKAKTREVSNVQDHKRRRFEKESASFSAARGLLPLNEFMVLLHKHCFTTYALSCCGGTRFSLTETLMRSHKCREADGKDHDDDYDDAFTLDPMTPIGQLPPTETHMRRLRFAISLDQPSSLLHYPHLFSVDSRYGTPSHFHDEYLRVTLETYLEQQGALMSIILGSAFAPQGVKNDDVALDSDGSMPFPALRFGMENQFRRILVGFEASNTFSKHLLSYCDLLRHEDDIRVEQFTDAPFFLNVPSLTQEDLEADVALAHDRRWPIEDEAASLSLLHLSLAARMTYVVWGFESVRSARMALTSLPSFAARFLEASVSRFGKMSGTTALVTENLKFVDHLKREYVNAVQRVKTGMGQQNELRQVALMESQRESLSNSQSALLNSRSVAVNASQALTVDALTFDLRCFYTSWKSIPQPLESMAPRGMQPKRSSAKKASVSVPEETADAICLPAVSDLARFLGVGRENLFSNDKVKRTKASKRPVGVQAALWGLNLRNETALMTYQMRLSKDLLEAVKGINFFSERSNEQAVTAAEDVHGECSGTGQSSRYLHKVGDTSNKKSIAQEGDDGATEEKVGPPVVVAASAGRTNDIETNASLRCQSEALLWERGALMRNVYAGCATLSLM